MRSAVKKILIIIDMQNDFITGCLGNKECEAVVKNVVDVINNGDYSNVILTRDTHHDNYPDTQEGRKLPVPHCIKNTEGWEINKQVMDAVNSKYNHKDIHIIDKPSFGSLELAAFLGCMKTYKDDEIDFVGVCTGICVISNVLLAKAAVPETKICVIENACACVTPESHKTAIEAMKTCQVDII